MAKVHSIRNHDLYPVLVQNGFNKAKLCGQGVKGFVISLGAAYIENLILAQHFNTNGLIFIKDFLDKDEVKNDFPDILQVFQQIFEGQADHLDFASRTKTEPELLERIYDFTIELFELPEVESIQELLESLIKACKRLNLQVFLYSSVDLLFELKENPFIYPLRLNLFESIENGLKIYYLLYHNNYQILDPSNNNTSLFFSPESSTDSSQLALCKSLIKELSSLSTLSPSEKLSLKGILKELKTLTPFGTTAENQLSSLLK